MKPRRREFLVRVLQAFGGIGAVAATARRAEACLYGKWWVVCPRGDADLVDDGTCQHRCEQHGLQVFRGNVVTVRCPNGHDNEIDTGRCDRACTGFSCPRCGRNCRVG